MLTWRDKIVMAGIFAAGGMCSFAFIGWVMGGRMDLWILAGGSIGLIVAAFWMGLMHG